DAEVTVDIGRGRLHPERAFEMIEGSPRVTLFDEDVREIEVCRGEFRLQLERLLIAGHGLVDTLLFAERRSEIVVRGGVIRLGGCGGALVCNSVIGPNYGLT